MIWWKFNTAHIKGSICQHQLYLTTCHCHGHVSRTLHTSRAVSAMTNCAQWCFTVMIMWKHYTHQRQYLACLTVFSYFSLSWNHHLLTFYSSELLGDLLRKRPKPSDSVDSVIIVDCIPQVGKDRLEKLKNVIKKLFSKFGNVVNTFYPVDEEGNTKGWVCNLF